MIPSYDTVTLSVGQTTIDYCSCPSKDAPLWFWMRRLSCWHTDRGIDPKPWTVWWNDAYPLSLPTACQIHPEMQTWSWLRKMEISLSKANYEELRRKVASTLTCTIVNLQKMKQWRINQKEGLTAFLFLIYTSTHRKREVWVRNYTIWNLLPST